MATAANSARAHAVEIALCGMNGRSMEVVRRSRLDHDIQVFETREAAIHVFGRYSAKREIC